MTMTTGTLVHFEPEDPGYAELQFSTVHNEGGVYDDVTVSVSVTQEEGVLVLVEPPLAVSAETARRVAELIYAAAKFCDGEPGNGDATHRAMRLIDLGYPLIAREVLRQSVETGVER
jgi:hypothetical protein